MSLKRTLERVPVDPGAEERAWSIVRAAFAERVPAPPRRRRWPLAAAAVAAAVVAAAFSPPGRAVVDSVRRSIGIDHAAPALFRLPAPGRLLVSGSGGTWVVSADGSKRLLGDYTQASWSPHGLFLVGTRSNQLAAIEPGNGTVHWSIARPHVEFARWGGTRADTRIAYLSAGRLHVVAGDGTGDVTLGPAAHVAPAWQPETHVLAYLTRAGRLVEVDTDTGRRLRSFAVAHGTHALAWSPDGKRLARIEPPRLVSSAQGGKARVLLLPHVSAIAFSSDGRIAALQGGAVLEVGPEGVETVFSARGRLAGLAWSPNGRWLVTSLPAADQWIFLDGRHVRAVSNIVRQFGGSVSLDGWASGA